MASSESRKKIVLQKYRTEIRNTLSQCIGDALPDLESSGAISTDQRDKVREYVDGKMPANAVDYLMDDHMKRPLSVESNKSFIKLLEVMKKAPKCSPQCKALAIIVEQDLKSDLSTEIDEITKMIERLGNDKSRLQEVIDQRKRRWKQWANQGVSYVEGMSYIYNINGYGSTSGSSSAEQKPLIRPLFLAKGPSDELFVRDYSTQRLVVFNNVKSDKLEYSHYFAGKGNGGGYFQDITGIAASSDHLYVADSELDYIQKLKLSGSYVQQIGSSGSGDGQFNTPFGLALDEAQSLLYVCDYENHRIQVFKDDKFDKKFGSKGSSQSYFNHPGDITLNHYKDQLYITDLDNHRVQVFTTNGSFIEVFGNTDVNNILRHPFGIFFTYSSGVLISSVHDDRVYLVSSDGTSISTIDYSFNCPTGVIMMDNGQIVVANMLGDKLTVI